MHEVDLVSHTHWDREWYRTFQQFRLRLVHLMDELLEIFATDPDFKHFMLDGQTIVLDDYLRIRPETEERLQELVQSGRLVIGPWHILPDMFLVSPEAHIRNLLEGDRETRRFGPKMPVGYMPDSFGHIGQMPQILRGFGIESACVWRGPGDEPAEFHWQSPDGSLVLMLYLRDSYSNGASLNAGAPTQFIEQLRQAVDSLAPHSAVSHLLVMYGTDHMEPPRATSNAIKCANEQLEGIRVSHSTLPAYLAAVKEEIDQKKVEIPTVAGELRSSKLSHLLPGVLSTRIWIKQRSHTCENLLERWAEPFSTFAALAATDVDLRGMLGNSTGILREAWRILMECYPHDSICGCSIDQVHDEMRPRFDQAEQIGEELTRQSLSALAGAVNTAYPMRGAKSDAAIVVFNPSSRGRTDIVSVEIALPPGVSDFEIVDDAGGVLPHQSASGKSADLINVRLRREELGGMLAMVNQGRAGNLAVRDLRFEREGSTLHIAAIFAEDAEPNLKVWESGLRTMEEYLKDTDLEFFHIDARSPESAKIRFAATDVAGMGWRIFHVRAKDSKPVEIKVTPIMRLLAPALQTPFVQKLLRRRSEEKCKPPYVIENESLSVELNTGDGTLAVTDKTTGKVWRGLNRFVDGGDRGDTYNFCPPQNDSRQEASGPQDVSILRGPVQQRLSARLVLRIPAGLSDDRKARSHEMLDIPITTTITLTRGVPRVDIHTRVDNRARDHRLRVHFAAPFDVQSAYYDGHFEIVERPLGVPPFDEAWIEEPRPEVPQRAFTYIADGADRLTVANRGLPEVEVLHRSEGGPHAEIALTLLRCVGWLARDDFPSRHGPAGPFIETPKAQMPGEWGFDYSIILSQDASASAQQARNYQAPLRASVEAIHTGNLPASGAFIQADTPSFIFTTAKKAEDRRGWIVRGYNVGSEQVSVRLKAWRRFDRVEQVNLAEETMRLLDMDAEGEVVVNAGGHEIVTVRFSDE